jgi:uncharacterized protein (TIGR02996 family)
MILETGNQLLLDILTNPKEDDLRLIYADWLDDQGDVDRAEFIRVQIELETLNKRLQSTEDCLDVECDGCHERRGLDIRLQDVWYPPGKGFVQPIETWNWRLTEVSPGELTSYGVVTRGFVSKIVCTCDEFMKYAEKLFTSHPIEEVVLTDREPYYTEYQADEGHSFYDNTKVIVITHPESNLPNELYELLEGHSRQNKHVKFYKERIEANFALSRACVRYGRTFLPKIKGV